MKVLLLLVFLGMCGRVWVATPQIPEIKFDFVREEDQYEDEDGAEEEEDEDDEDGEDEEEDKDEGEELVNLHDKVAQEAATIRIQTQEDMRDFYHVDEPKIAVDLDEEKYESFEDYLQRMQRTDFKKLQRGIPVEKVMKSDEDDK